MGMIKTKKEIIEISKMAERISELLRKSLSWVRPGITTFALDALIEAEINRMGVVGPCKGYEGFPAVSCLSVNDQVTHGVPDDTLLKEGDLIDIDLVIEKNGYFADCSKTIGVGKISNEASRLVSVTEECLNRGIQAAQPGNTLGDIGFAIQCHAESNQYSVVRDYTGHFIGRSMHEEPMVENRGVPHRGIKLKPGMIFCIEPMINQGGYGVVTRGWDARTSDGKLSSRCEHMVLITPTGNQVLTSH
ncbi:type I methionyl aminopeptidase [Pontiella sulfatireligans]|uniref:Methionine aminopeptidase n=1 Tax=Pontiella sulfatireligans TaxID=2750658 RepID=A0A6C2UT38_9BACT|nr:type I methionyl aminopeptidase [Pontiella sulfatireligans]VGO23500.1 Methionine aminopeptidase 1 [Pontiella sulfatireligans]